MKLQFTTKIQNWSLQTISVIAEYDHEIEDAVVEQVLIYANNQSIDITELLNSISPDITYYIGNEIDWKKLMAEYAQDMADYNAESQYLDYLSWKNRTI